MSKRNSSVDLGDEHLPGEPGVGEPAPKSETVILFAKSMPPDKQEREFTVREAEKLLNYEKAGNMENWVIKEGQNYEFKDGRIRSTNTGPASDVTE